MLEFKFSEEAIDSLMAAGAEFGQIAPGKSITFAGRELVLPPELFDLFNELKNNGQVLIQPADF